MRTLLATLVCIASVVASGEVLAHRLIVSPAARIRNLDTRDTVEEILDSLPVPGATAA